MVKFELTKEEYLDIIVDSFENGKIAYYNKFMKYKTGSLYFFLHLFLIVAFLMIVFLDYVFLLGLIVFLFFSLFLLAENSYYINKAKKFKNELENRLSNIKSYLNEIKKIIIEIDEKVVKCETLLENEEIELISFDKNNIDFLEYHDDNIEIYNIEDSFVFLPLSKLERKERGGVLRKFYWNFKDVKKAKSF